MHKVGLQEISVYTQIAISFRRYAQARRCIFVNMDNEGVTEEEQQKLTQMVKAIDTAVNKEKAIEMLSGENANIRQVMHETNLSEIEIIQIQKRLSGQPSAPQVRQKLPYDD